ncbi:hypothetical protein Pan189_37770 [Stratiformator vulcanicus]|uniref:Uncharacterized protein n=1 Tax=Stratiformator vulcanicus TaxID=2527980 RepID=A0A517R672_9PLAN|nr:hypothetical protein Pan189_37770 [Stratiformator vulcanicus]
MKDTAAVGVRNRIAQVDEATDETAKRGVAFSRCLAFLTVIFFSGFFQALPADELHRVIGTAVCVGTKSVNGHNPGMLQLAGHLGFQ